MLNDSIRYENGELYCDGIAINTITAQTGTPVYIYSLSRALKNLERIRKAFMGLETHIHYSAKANANLSILRTLQQAGAGIDAVSGGEIYRALAAGAPPESIVFAGAGKSTSELEYAIEQHVGWINVENLAECETINTLTGKLGLPPTRIALRLNPDVTAQTHPYIATGHGGAKFGLTAATIRDLLSRQSEYPHIDFAGIHVHIGSQLHDTAATAAAIEKAVDLIRPYPHIKTVNIGGGLPVDYGTDGTLPGFEDFVAALRPLLEGYTVLLEPGRSIIADAGILVTETQYIKQQAGQTFAIVDASMTELIRPALYQAKHQIIPLCETAAPTTATTVVGPVCETADVLGKDIPLPALNPGDKLVVLTAGAYGMVMASNYNARPRPAEVVVEPDGCTWKIARQRETWADLLRGEN